jgi:hypothetical protein
VTRTGPRTADLFLRSRRSDLEPCGPAGVQPSCHYIAWGCRRQPAHTEGDKGMRFRSVIMLSAAAVVLSLVSSTSISMASECCSTIQARLLPPYSPRIVHDKDTRLRKVLCDIHRDPGYGRCINRCEQIDDNGAKDDCWYSCNVQFGCGQH